MVRAVLALPVLALVAFASFLAVVAVGLVAALVRGILAVGGVPLRLAGVRRGRAAPG